MYDCNKGCGRMITMRGGTCYHCRKKKPLGKIPFETVEKVTLEHDGVVREHEFSTHFSFAGREVVLPNSRITVEERKNTITVPVWLALDRGIGQFEVRRKGA